jgi:hypothetical protein
MLLNSDPQLIRDVCALYRDTSTALCDGTP